MSSPLTEGVSWEIIEFTPEEGVCGTGAEEAGFTIVATSVVLCTGGIPYEGVLTVPKPDPSSPLPPLIVAPHGRHLLPPSSRLILSFILSLPSSPSPLSPPSISHIAGGPHVVFTANFLPWPVCLTALGFAVLMGKIQLGKGRGRRRGGEVGDTLQNNSMLGLMVCCYGDMLLW